MKDKNNKKQRVVEGENENKNPSDKRKKNKGRKKESRWIKTDFKKKNVFQRMNSKKRKDKQET